MADFPGKGKVAVLKTSPGDGSGRYRKIDEAGRF